MPTVTSDNLDEFNKKKLDVTDYESDKTYRMEKEPKKRKAETLALLGAGVNTLNVDQALTRSEWINKNIPMHERLYLRHKERQELVKYQGKKNG